MKTAQEIEKQKQYIRQIKEINENKKLKYFILIQNQFCLLPYLLIYIELLLYRQF